MLAKNAMNPHNGHDRIAQFPNVVRELELSLRETERLRARYDGALMEGMSKLRDFVRQEVDEGIRNYARIHQAVTSFRGELRLRRDEHHGKFLYYHPKGEIALTQAIDKLFIALSREGE